MQSRAFIKHVTTNRIAGTMYSPCIIQSIDNAPSALLKSQAIARFCRANAPHRTGHPCGWIHACAKSSATVKFGRCCDLSWLVFDSDQWMNFQQISVISMNCRSSYWILLEFPLDFKGFQWMSINLKWLQWTFNGFVWFPKSLQWVPMGFVECPMGFIEFN